MFSSNQIMEITGTMEDIESVLRFALKMSGNEKNYKDQKEIERGCKLVYQITPTHKYCIGWGFKTVQPGWKEYDFDFDPEIVAKIIAQHLKKYEPNNEEELEYFDGSTSKGFHMSADVWSDKGEDIQSKNYCIVFFEPHILLYAK